MNLSTQFATGLLDADRRISGRTNQQASKFNTITFGTWDDVLQFELTFAETWDGHTEATVFLTSFEFDHKTYPLSNIMNIFPVSAEVDATVSATISWLEEQRRTLQSSFEKALVLIQGIMEISNEDKKDHVMQAAKLLLTTAFA